MARSGADVLSAHGLREQVPRIPAGFEGFEMGGNRKQRSCSLLHARTNHRLESTKLSGDMGGVRPETLRDRTSRMSPQGWVHDVSMGVSPRVAADQMAPSAKNPNA